MYVQDSGDRILQGKVNQVMPGFLNIENKKASSAGMQCCGYEFVL